MNESGELSISNAELSFSTMRSLDDNSPLGSARDSLRLSLPVTPTDASLNVSPSSGFPTSRIPRPTPNSRTTLPTLSYSEPNVRKPRIKLIIPGRVPGRGPNRVSRSPNRITRSPNRVSRTEIGHNVGFSKSKPPEFMDPYEIQAFIRKCQAFQKRVKQLKTSHQKAMDQMRLKNKNLENKLRARKENWGAEKEMLLKRLALFESPADTQKHLQLVSGDSIKQTTQVSSPAVMTEGIDDGMDDQMLRRNSSGRISGTPRGEKHKESCTIG